MKKISQKEKVAVAMSGGVDSGVAAGLLVRQGYEVVGFHLRLWHEALTGSFPGGSFENKCCDVGSLEAARKTAWKLGIPFYVLDFAEIFKEKVVDYFLSEYAAGRTPNPCVMCNKYIKFGEFLRYVRGLGFDYLATGHYVRIYEEIQNSKSKIQNKFKIQNSKFKIYHLLEAKDKSKDQSYFLYNLTQQQLAHILFPVGEYTKNEVREMAKKWGLAVAERPESQEICFFPESDYRPFLRRQIPEKIIPGEVVNTKGRLIGRHFGLPLYTIGQRHGFEIRTKNLQHRTKGIIPPYYVVGKDSEKNRLIVGFGREAEKKDFWVKDVNWIDPNFQFSIFNFQLFVRIRHQGELLNCQIAKLPNCQIKVILDEPYRGIAPGQAAVFYKKLKVKSQKLKVIFEVLGGGIILIAG
jgi:tRNA-specific 2-thiouridylase